jgi:iron complex outermembrane recepter protein
VRYQSRLLSTVSMIGLASLGVIPKAAYAQQMAAADANSQLEEIVVTAERRETLMQKTPLAIAAVTGDTLRDEHIVTLEDLDAKVPSLSFSQNGGGGARVFIRGVGLDSVAPGSDPRVAVYTDGVYNARPDAVLASMYDIERVEVVSGPQGTLYGRNATAGAINILSRDPGNVWNGYGTMTVGSQSLIQTEGAVGGPLSDALSSRIAFQTADRSGFGRNTFTGDDSVDDLHTRSLRGTVKYYAGPGFDVVAKADYFKEDDHSGGYHYVGAQPGAIPVSARFGYVPPSNLRDSPGWGPDFYEEAYGASVTANVDLGGPRLTSVTGYRSIYTHAVTTVDGTTARFNKGDYVENSRELTQELRLSQTIGRFDFLLGGYYFHEENFAGLQAAVAGVNFGEKTPDAQNLRKGALIFGNQGTNAFAGFGQLTIHITDALGVDAGARYSDERRSVSQASQIDAKTNYDPFAPLVFVANPAIASFNSAHASWTSTDPKATIHYQFSDNIYGYVTYSQGFKSGGFALTAIQPAFAPEKIRDTEGGVKMDLFDRRVRINLAGFHYDYKDLQVTKNTAISYITENAAAAELYGAEGDVTFIPVENWRLNLNVAWDHSAFTNYQTSDQNRPSLGVINLDGNPLSYAPTYRAGAEVSYTAHSSFGDFTPRVGAIYTDRVYFSPFKLNYFGAAPWTDVNLYLHYENKQLSGWSVDGYMLNATDHTYLVGGAISALGGNNILGIFGPPRTFGVSVTKRF